MSAPGWHRSEPEEDDQDWKTRASCRAGGTDDEIWFPMRKNNARFGKRVCNGPDPVNHPEWGCPVKEQCLADAIASDDRWGTRGGLDMWERAALENRKSPYRSFS
jgi:WhiB family redox-sensing transcriptional regulator